MHKMSPFRKIQNTDRNRDNHEVTGRWSDKAGMWRYNDNKNLILVEKPGV